MISYLNKAYASLGRFRALYLISAIELLVMVVWSVYTGAGLHWHPDTPYYYQSYDVLMTGRLDPARTPVYLLVIGIPRTILGETLSVITVYLFQSIIFLCSIRWIGRMLEKITKYSRLSYLMTAVYATYPGILSFCGIILTESLTISLVSAELYLVSEAYFNNSYKKAFLSGIICLLLCMLRPSTIMVPVLLAFMWIALLIFKRKRMLKTVLWGLSSVMVSMGLVGLYALAFEKEYHTVALTSVSMANHYIIIRKAKVINTDIIENPELKADIDSLFKVNGVDGSGVPWWYEACTLCDRHGFGEFDKFVKKQIIYSSKDLATYLYRDQFELMLHSSCIFTGAPIPPIMCSVIRPVWIHNGTAFLIFIVGLLFLLSKDLRQRRISYFEWLLFAMFAGNYFTVLVGAPNDFSRLLAQNYPVLIAISCWVLSQLVRSASMRAEIQTQVI